MIIKNVIEKYKNLRKQNYLNHPLNYKSKFAFIGVGNHSISNLYPCLDYLSVPLKYVLTKNISNAKKMALRYKGAIGTDNLDMILKDDEVKGVFLCSDPALHFELTMKILLANKFVFVEKPPCLTLEELEELKSTEEKTGQVCLVGLQKRYSNVYSILKKQSKEPASYNLRYLTGAYPEGDEILDLFIHPLDIIIYLFGDVEKVAIKAVKRNRNTTLFLLAEHKSGVKGSLELSTDYSWSGAEERLIVNTSKGVFEVKGMNKLIFTPKSQSVMGIPFEKVLSFHLKHEILFDNTGFVPIGKYNQVYTHGYFNEIEAFVNLVEGRKGDIRTSLDDITATYQLMSEIKSHGA
ncbi:MAG: Gfo/Idh/MocA family oxidoreductase [Bacteroidetes bacterium]|nr:Gfo/Idh/MocA family oxidoreductase [Bacteroidota bacterium]